MKHPLTHHKMPHPDLKNAASRPLSAPSPRHHSDPALQALPLQLTPSAHLLPYTKCKFDAAMNATYDAIKAPAKRHIKAHFAATEIRLLSSCISATYRKTQPLQVTLQGYSQSHIRSSFSHTSVTHQTHFITHIKRI